MGFFSSSSTPAATATAAPVVGASSGDSFDLSAGGPAAAIGQLDDQTQRELAKFLEAENAKARLQQTIHTFTDMCWDKCITGSVRSASLDRTESSCLANCVERFLDTSVAIVRRLEEQRH
ncbi:hypothetical protein GQ42DRAFT_165373 [Ramicandelaber brevisporus]|nr:hypothetical protein GQ42DRAFT_165373 [Ramicandelaber brevisporus]